MCKDATVVVELCGIGVGGWESCEMELSLTCRAASERKGVKSTYSCERLIEICAFVFWCRGWGVVVVLIILFVCGV